MKHQLKILYLKNAFRCADIEINNYKIDQLIKYEEMLKLWSKRINLVSHKDINYIVERHFFPSIWLSSVVIKHQPNKILDIGSGAGFPGLVLCILLPETEVVLIDSIRKKILFLEEVVNSLNVKAKLVMGRVEKVFEKSVDKFDMTVNRAVGSLSQLWSWSQPLLKENGSMLSLKGDDFIKETDNISKYMTKFEMITPDDKWFKISPEIKNKRIIRVQNYNERK